MRRTGDLGPDHDLDLAAQLVAGMVGSVDAGLDEVLATGVGIPAPIDPGTGAVSTPGLLRGWDDVRVAEELGARVHGAVHVDNEANLGALAELRMGAARGADQAAYIRVSHGVGAGLIVDGHVHRGSSGKAGEIGHTRIDEDGPLCRCGNRGCLETFIGEAALVGNLGPGHGGVGIRDLVVMAATGDPPGHRGRGPAPRHRRREPEQPGGPGSDRDRRRTGRGRGDPAGADAAGSGAGGAADAGGTPEVVRSELGDRAEALGAVLFAIDSAQLGSLAGQSGAILAS